MSSEDNDKDEPVGHILTAGAVVDFLHKFFLPVIALPGRRLYRVVVHGHGFKLPIEDDAAIGFYLTRFVAAGTIREAEEKAINLTRDRWDTFYSAAEGELKLEIEEIDEQDSRFVWRSRYGVAFYKSE
jgi:hypothetical protein